MKAKFARELYWLLGTVVVTGLIGLWIFGGQMFDSAPIEIQLHDTYLIFPKIHFLIVLLIALLTTTYLVRVIYYKLNNRIVNGVLSFLLMLALVLQVIGLIWVNSLVTYARSGMLSGFKVTEWTLGALIIITAAMLATTGYKTFRAKEYADKIFLR